MGINNDEGQGNEFNSSKNLEPVNPNIVTSYFNKDDRSVLEQFTEVYPTYMGQAMVLMLSQDEANLKLTINELQMVSNEAKTISKDEIEISVMDYMIGMITFFEPLLRSMRFMNQGRFETAAKEFTKLKDTCSLSVNDLTDIYKKAGVDQQNIINYLITFFKVYGGWMIGYEKYCEAESVGYQGKTNQYASMLRITVEQLRDTITLVPPGSPDEIVQVAMMCGKLADQFEVRAETFEKIDSSKRYLETSGEKLFIIHGHDEAKWRELRDLLEDEFKLPVVVLKEEAGVARTIIKKFEDYAMDSCYAFAILTPDDFVTKGKSKYLQARPNVLFEMGWFYGRFGPHNLCILKKKGTQIPSDLEGISTIEFKEGVEEQSLAIRKELRQAGLVE